MKVLREIEELAEVPGPVALAIGVFDGVHLGHQEVIRAAQEHARQHQGTAVVMTFDPHPMSVLAPESAPSRLCGAEHQRQILLDLGVSHLLVCAFTPEFAATPAEVFLERLIAASKPLGCISVGYGWRFGRDGGGDVRLLIECGRARGFAVYGVPEVQLDGAPVSSTRIREAVKEGCFDEAGRLLSRVYTVLGTVVEGRKLGRTIGVPTANVETGDGLVPPTGVYAVRALVEGVWRDGVANLGRRPTVDPGDSPVKLEVHLLDFDGDLYGQKIEVAFVAKLRDERRFDGLEALKAQIAGDILRAGEVLGR